MGSFANEIKDFLGAATTTIKTLGTPEDRAYKKARTAYMKAKADVASDPEMRKGMLDKLRAQIKRLGMGPQMHPATERMINEKTKYYHDSNPANQPKPAGPADEIQPRVGPSGAIDQTEDGYKTASGYDNQGYESDTTADALALGGGSELAGDYGGSEDSEFSASGGMVGSGVTSRGNKPKPMAIKIKGYADGGTVEEDDVQDSYDDADSTPSVADDVEAAPDAEDDGDDPVAAVGDVKARNAEKPKIDYEMAHQAVLEGVKYNQAHRADAPAEGGDGAVTTEVSAASRKPAAPAGLGRRPSGSTQPAISASEMAAIEAKVDKNHTMSEAERKMAAFSELYNWKLTREGPEAADRVAGAMADYMELQSGMHRALAQVAAGHGDVTTTIREAARYYANVPDGNNVKFSNENGKIKASFTDMETGKEVEKFIVSPDELLQWASKGGIPNFNALLARSAAGRDRLAKEKAGVEHDEDRTDKKIQNARKMVSEDEAARQELENAPKVEAAAAAKEARENRKVDALETTSKARMLDAETKAAASQVFKPNELKEVEADMKEQVDTLPKEQKAQGPELGAIGIQLRAANRNVGTQDTFRAAREITQLSDPANPSKTTFSVQEGDKYDTFKLSNGQSFKVPVELSARMRRLRDENMKTAQAALDKASAQGARNQSTGKAITAGVGNAGNALYGNPAPARGVPVLGRPGFGISTTPLDEAPPGSVPRRGLGEM